MTSRVAMATMSAHDTRLVHGGAASTAALALITVSKPASEVRNFCGDLSQPSYFQMMPQLPMHHIHIIYKFSTRKKSKRIGIFTLASFIHIRVKNSFGCLLFFIRVSAPSLSGMTWSWFLLSGRALGSANTSSYCLPNLWSDSGKRVPPSTLKTSYSALAFPSS